MLWLTACELCPADQLIDILDTCDSTALCFELHRTSDSLMVITQSRWHIGYWWL